MIDDALLQALFPELLSAYIARFGYHKVDEGALTEVWRYKNRDLLLPKTEDVDDYPGVVASAIEAMTRQLNRSLEAIVTDLQVGRFDIIELPATTDIDWLSNPPLKLAIQSSEALKQLLTGVAVSVSSGSKSGLVGRIPSDVNRFIEFTRFGVFRNGRTSLAAFSPVTFESRQTRTQKSHLPISDIENNSSLGFERKVTLKISKALAAVNEAVQIFVSGTEDGIFERTVDKGVNTMVLESLKQIARLPRHDATMTVLYSGLIANEVPKQNLIVVSESHRDILDEGIKRLKRRSTPLLETVEGSIIKIARGYEDQNGIVTMAVDRSSDSPLKVRMRLLDDDFNRASDANRQRIKCSVVGIIDRGPDGKGWFLENARDVILLPQQNVDSSESS